MLLTPSQARAVYEHAVTNGYAVLAVNADSPAAVTDCLIAAAACDAPIIIETSLWQLTGHSFGAGDPIAGMDRYLADLRAIASSARFAGVPVIYHTDHIKGDGTREILEHAISQGASSISLDSSDLAPKENIELMSSLCAFAEKHSLEATMEMEAGVDDGVTELGEGEALFGAVEQRYPGYLALWAPGVGTQHGLNSGTAGFSATAVKEHREMASGIAGRPVGIALHGSSGLSSEQLSDAVGAGVAKVNWSSESLLIRSQAARHYFMTHEAELQKGHPDFKATAMDHGMQSAVSDAYVPRVVERINVLGGANQASSILNLFATA